jgi:hypothetical protein
MEEEEQHPHLAKNETKTSSPAEEVSLLHFSSLNSHIARRVYNCKIWSLCIGIHVSPVCSKTLYAI